MALRKNARGLRFPCECVSVLRGYSDPWAAIAQDKLLNDGTKERVLNSVSQQPKTIARLAAELGLSQPAVYSHVSDLLSSELLREAKNWEKQHPAENYYEPNFPVIQAAEQKALQPVCEAIGEQMARLFEVKVNELRHAMEQTALADRGWEASDIAQFCFASAQRGARRLLEQRGVLSPGRKHKNGSEWVFWAEEAASTGK